MKRENREIWKIEKKGKFLPGGRIWAREKDLDRVEMEVVGGIGRWRR